MKKVAIFFLALLFFFCQKPVTGASEAVKLYFFYGNGCSHCAKEMQFLQELKKRHSKLEIASYEVSQNRENALVLQKVGKFLNVKISGVPFSVIGDKYFIGYAEDLVSKDIEKAVAECEKEACPDRVAGIISSKDQEGKKGSADSQKNPGKKINLPLWGEIDVRSFSLPAMTVAFGFLDGFNPCAMWTLLFLISLLLGMKNKRRMWILGITFIVASAAVYFLFMSAWLNLILFLGFIFWVRILIAVLAVFGGGYNLKKFISKKGSGCEVADDKRRQKIFQKLKSLVERNNFYIAFFGIISLAFLVNLVELVCSAGFPAVYTQVLAINDLPFWKYYLYILLYIFFFMLDDLLVFFVAMVTFEMTGISTKYSKYSRLAGGIIMIAIGVILALRPGWLMFG